MIDFSLVPFCRGSAPVLLALLVFSSSCKDNKDSQVDAGLPTTTTAHVDAAIAAAVDITQCAGCQLTAQQAWTFEGIFADSACTDPLAQLAPSACAVVPALGQQNITYSDAVGGRKVGEAATVTLVEQVAAATPRYRKAGTACVRANESAIDITPPGCAGQRVCRDATGALACTNCRTFANGCPDFEETRMYATVTDPVAKGAAGQGGNATVIRLRQCCAALGAEAKRLGASPEAGMIAAAAAQCNTLAAAAGPNGTAPELGALRSLLAGRNVPAICAGL